MVTRIGIHQVEYSTTQNGTIIHIFGRTPEGKLTVVDVYNFQPYFYIPKLQADAMRHPTQIKVDTVNVYRTIKGEPLRRLYTSRPQDIRELRERYQHYEADIPFTTRFMIDNKIHGGVEISGETTFVNVADVKPIEVDAPARICVMDIECEDERGFPEAERDAIICVTCWDSFDDAYTTFFLTQQVRDEAYRQLGKDKACTINGNRTICYYDTEVDLLQGLTEYIQKKDPDVLTGWNFIDFDMPYTTKRMTTIGLKPENLARLKGGSPERNVIRGRALFDLLTAYKKMQQGKKESYRLDAIAEEELGEHKIHHSGTLCELWRTDPAKLIEYNYKDVELCVGINKKNSVVDFYREIARYVGCPLDRTLNTSQIVDIFILHKAHGRFALPSKGQTAGEEFEGATVFSPAMGVKENLAVFDLTSLYPMAMMTLNASPETKDPNGELKAPNGACFRKSPDGLTREILGELFEERKARKKLRDTFAYGTREYKVLDMQQNVIKVIMNSYYGVSGYARFRLYDREIGSAVTAVGRAIIEHTRRVIEDIGYHVVYGDTDSTFVQIPPMELDKTIELAREIEKTLNASYDEFARTTLNAEKHFFSTKFEKLYKRFFQAGKKKRYGGHLIWKEGKTVDKIDIAGFENKRSDSPALTRKVEEKVIEMILRGKEFPEVKAYLSKVIKDYRAGKYSLDEIGIPGGFGKQLEEYENKDAHVRGALYANQYLGGSFVRGSKPKRVYIKFVRSKYPQTDVICFEYADQVPPEFVVDLDTMLLKTIQTPIERIIGVMGWTWDSVDPCVATLDQFW